MPTHEEKKLPKSLGSSAEPDASKDPTIDFLVTSKVQTRQ
ncbi:hypothetical protein A2U01_0074272, partial [Trifolium medium]|nr:hypothetical protein [Trifolium medium]